MIRIVFGKLVRPLSPRILPVYFAAFCLLLIYVFAYQKKKKKMIRIVRRGAWIRSILDGDEVNPMK